MALGGLGIEHGRSGLSRSIALFACRLDGSLGSDYVIVHHADPVLQYMQQGAFQAPSAQYWMCVELRMLPVVPAPCIRRHYNNSNESFHGHTSGITASK